MTLTEYLETYIRSTGDKNTFLASTIEGTLIVRFNGNETNIALSSRQVKVLGDDSLVEVVCEIIQHHYKKPKAIKLISTLDIKLSEIIEILEDKGYKIL